MPTIYKPKKKREYHDWQQNRKKRQSVYNTTTWHNIRLAKIMECPECEICAIEGRVTLAEDVHHALSFLEVDDDVMLNVAYDSTNLISVCKKCHSRCHTGDLKGTHSLDEIRERIKSLSKKKNTTDR